MFSRPEKKVKQYMKYLSNLNNFNYYIKGSTNPGDSTSKQLVLAAGDDKDFDPRACYFDYVRNLPMGTVYIDCEKDYRPKTAYLASK